MSWRLVAPGILIAAALPASAWDGCNEQDDRSAEADTAGVERIEVRAGAGDLEVVGRPDTTRVLAEGRACARDAGDLEAIGLRAERAGTTLRVEVDLPRDLDNVYLDLRIEMPAGIEVDVVDSSGDLRVRGVAALRVRDSSGDIEVEDVTGAVVARDSSGDIEIRRAGDVHVESDSSGEVRIFEAASVRVDVDSSGDIVMRDVRGDVSVGTDSSGSIQAWRVGGDFTVDSDGSGEIEHDAVAGVVRIPRD
jgi:DUF4097 and DUF4098 domain-containing protein YvlB